MKKVFLFFIILGVVLMISCKPYDFYNSGTSNNSNNSSNLSSSSNLNNSSNPNSSSNLNNSNNPSNSSNSGNSNCSIYSQEPTISLSAQVQRIIKKINDAAESVNIVINENEIFAPAILVESRQDIDIKVTKIDTADGFLVEYLPKLLKSNKNGYTIESIKIGKISKEQKNENEMQIATTFSKYNKNNKLFYYAYEYKSYMSSLLINMIFYPNDTTMCFFVVYIANELTASDKLLENTYKDFQCSSLAELRNLYCE